MSVYDESDDRIRKRPTLPSNDCPEEPVDVLTSVTIRLGSLAEDLGRMTLDLALMVGEVRGVVARVTTIEGHVGDLRTRVEGLERAARGEK
jgi:hypothetical protein